MTTPNNILIIKRALKNDSIKSHNVKVKKLNGVPDYLSGFITLQNEMHYYLSISYHTDAINNGKLMIRKVENIKNSTSGNYSNNWIAPEDFAAFCDKNNK